MDLILQKAKKWAEKVWIDAIASWFEKPVQDYAYRKYVIEPVLSKMINELNLDSKSLIVEAGCGEGSHSIFWRQILNNSGLSKVKIFGIDLLKPFIVKAKENASDYKNISFKVADVTKVNTAAMIHDKVGIPNVIMAMFLLQDIPDLEGLLKMAKLCLAKRGHFIAVFVYPNFAGYLLKAGHLKKLADGSFPKNFITENGIVQWRFVGYYPLARTDSPPFYLPYFHRSLTDYYKAFKSNGFEITHKIPLMPNPKEAAIYKKKRILPFCKGKWNIYWPFIINGPSSMLIHAIKVKNEKSKA